MSEGLCTARVWFCATHHLCQVWLCPVLRRIWAAKWLQGELIYLTDSMGRDHTSSKIESFPSADTTDLCYGHAVTGPNPRKDWEPDCGPDSSCCGSLQLCWVGWNLKSCCWLYKNMVEVMCQLHGCLWLFLCMQLNFAVWKPAVR